MPVNFIEYLLLVTKAFKSYAENAK